MIVGNIFPHFKDFDGTSLEAGYIYFGKANLNPETDPVSVYWDNDLTQPAAQPLRTINGSIGRDGTPANVYCNENYSITVKDKKGSLLYYLPDSNYFDPASLINLKSIKIVNSIAELRTLLKDGVPYANVLGYYSKGDGGGGLYYLAPADISNVDNGGTVIIANDGGCWKLQQSTDATLLQFGAKGDYSADATAAINAAFSACPKIVIPDGKVFKVSNTLNINNANTTLCGSGELRFTSAISGKAAIYVNADGFEADGICLTNPTHDSPKTGNRTYGILVHANDSYIHGCTVDGFQNGIVVDATGEYFNFRICDNFVLNVAGAGDGPSNTTSSLGEDRGDGITVWGAVGTISGNLVTALTGTDARCGIFVEQLSAFENSTPVDSDSLFTIVGNIVRGPFRRSIDSEGLYGVTIANNICNSGNWGAIQVSANSNHVSVTGNIVQYSRASSDLTGQAYTPWRCGIVAYANAANVLIANNEIRIPGYGDGIFISGTSGSRQKDVLVTGNIVQYPGNANGIGIKLQYCDYPQITDNKIVNAGSYTSNNYYGIYGFDLTHPHIANNHIQLGIGPGGYNSEGIHNESNVIGGVINSNTIISAKTGIISFNKSYLSIQNNRFVGATAAGDLFGCSNSIVMGNLLGGATAFANIANGSSGNVVVNNVA